MNGCSFKAVVLTFTLVLTVCCPGLIIAATTVDGADKNKMYRAQLGCMACHQGEATRAATTEPKNQNNLPQVSATARTG